MNKLELRVVLVVTGAIVVRGFRSHQAYMRDIVRFADTRESGETNSVVLCRLASARSEGKAAIKAASRWCACSIGSCKLLRQCQYYKHTIILSYYHTIILSYYHTIILSYYHTGFL